MTLIWISRYSEYVIMSEKFYFYLIIHQGNNGTFVHCEPGFLLEVLQDLSLRVQDNPNYVGRS